MLQPNEIQEIVDTLFPLLDGLNLWITEDLIRRLMARLGRDEGFLLTGTDEWQMQVLQEAGGHLEAVQQRIRAFTGASEEEIAKIFEDAGIRALRADNQIYARMGQRELPLSDRMVRILQDAYERTNGEIRNFTRTTADQSQRELIRALDEAHLKVMTGSQSYSSAVREAVEKLASSNATVRYPTGHVENLETAVLRAVRTGVSQATGNMTLMGLEERGWDLIRTSAHIGARYGDGGENPGNHFWWQGKLFSLTGRTKGYPLFYESTGYGTGEGLGGYNCRHSFGPGDPNHNPYQDFDSEENKRVYDLSQKQRNLERDIRHSKSIMLSYKTAIENCTDDEARQKLQEGYDRTASQLSSRNKAYNEFCETNGLKRYNARLHAVKWNRSEASKAAITSRQIDTFTEKVMSAEKTSTGIAITAVSTHVFTRARFRGLSAEQVTDALTRPLSLGTIKVDRSQQFIGESATVAINVDTGKITTCWPTRTRKVKKLKGKGGMV